MSDTEFPAGDTPADADEFFAMLASEVPALAGILTATLTPGTPIDFGPVAAAFEGLSDADRHRAEQLFASFNAGAIRSKVAELAVSATDDAILAAVLTVHPRSDEQVLVDPSILQSFTVLLAAARSLATDASDVAALRVLLAAGYADTLVSVDPDTLVRDIDPMARQLAVTALADRFVELISVPAARLTEVFTQHPNASVRFNLGTLNTLTNDVFVQLLAYYPDVVEHFDALLAERVSDAADRL